MSILAEQQESLKPKKVHKKSPSYMNYKNSKKWIYNKKRRFDRTMKKQPNNKQNLAAYKTWLLANKEYFLMTTDKVNLEINKYV